MIYGKEQHEVNDSEIAFSCAIIYNIYYILSTEHLWRYTCECIANGGPLPTRVQMFRFVC